jgi:hypothetical protein
MQRYKTLNTIIVFSVILRFCDAFQELCEIEQGVCGIEAEEMGNRTAEPQGAQRFHGLWRSLRIPCVPCGFKGLKQKFRARAVVVPGIICASVAKSYPPFL